MRRLVHNCEGKRRGGIKAQTIVKASPLPFSFPFPSFRLGSCPTDTHTCICLHPSYPPRCCPSVSLLST